MPANESQLIDFGNQLEMKSQLENESQLIDFDKSRRALVRTDQGD